MEKKWYLKNNELRYRKALDNIKHYREHFRDFIDGKEAMITHEQRRAFINETIEWAFSGEECDPPEGRPNGIRAYVPG